MVAFCFFSRFVGLILVFVLVCDCIVVWISGGWVRNLDLNLVVGLRECFTFVWLEGGGGGFGRWVSCGEVFVEEFMSE